MRVGSLTESLTISSAEGHENVSWTRSRTRQSTLTFLLQQNPSLLRNPLKSCLWKKVSHPLGIERGTINIPSFLSQHQWRSWIIVNHPSRRNFRVYPLLSFPTMYCQVSSWISFDPSRWNWQLQICTGLVPHCCWIGKEPQVWGQLNLALRLCCVSLVIASSNRRSTSFS